MSGLGITAGDTQNAYLAAPSSEKHYATLGTEFGIGSKGKVALAACHFAREGCARGERRAGCARPEESQAGLLSKPLPAGAKREKLVGNVLHHAYGKASGVEHESL